jgi:hypothetical protein
VSIQTLPELMYTPAPSLGGSQLLVRLQVGMAGRIT